MFARKEIDDANASRTAPAVSVFRLYLRTALITVLPAILCSCASLPKDVERTPSLALVHTEDTRLGRAVGERTAAHPGKDGIFPLANGRDAFAARVLLAAAAERSLDLQYYIWKPDTTGQLLFEEVWKAAQRGVRVRMLLDDQQTRKLDATIAALDSHPNIEVRLFNPYANRHFRAGDIATDFARINRRMHNKSFNADNQVAIVGGRNIGDEYYGADPRLDYNDLDVLAAGPAVRDVSHEFDLYWNSASAYPAASVIGQAAFDGETCLRDGWTKVRQDPEALRYVDAVRHTPLVRQLLERKLPLEWTNARIIYDDPAKVQPPESTETHLLPQIEATLGRPMRELDLVSPYFVPGKEGMQAFAALGKRGVQLRVVTNSLAATDVSPVHAGYKKYRKALLRSGARIYELKPSAELQNRKEEGDDDDNDKYDGIGGSSASALHAKTFSVDRSRIFVGSFNLDPRSSRLNTEMGAVIDSPTLARRLSEAIDTRVPNDAYEVRLAADGHHLEWIERSSEGNVVYTTEPQTGVLRRIWVGFLSILPIEGLL
jgi:putative cardiolipin synthase